MFSGGIGIDQWHEMLLVEEAYLEFYQISMIELLYESS